MKRIFGTVLLLGSSIVGCSGSSSGGAAFDEAAAGSSHLRLDIACGSNADCPTAFECETETEHGVTTSFCSSIDVVSTTGSGGAMCPAGFEIEQEHGTSFCKPHGGDEHDGASGGSDGGESEHEAGDDHGGARGDEGSGHDGNEDESAGGSSHGASDDVGDDHGADASNDGPDHDGGDDQGAGGSDDGHGHGGK